MNLGVQDGLRVSCHQHLVERVKQEVNVDSERVLVLAASRSGEQDPGLDHELGNELQRTEALLDRLLIIRGCGEVSTVTNTAQ